MSKADFRGGNASPTQPTQEIDGSSPEGDSLDDHVIPTESIPQEAVEGTLDEAAAPPVASQAPQEDVYVILPEGEAQDIPVVDTEVVVLEDGEFPPTTGIEDLGTQTETMADDREDGLSSDEEAALEPGAQSLETLEAGLDDDLLAPPVGADARPSRGLSSADELPEPRGQWLRVGLPAAAALLLAAGVGFYYFQDQIPGFASLDPIVAVPTPSPTTGLPVSIEPGEGVGVQTAPVTTDPSSVGGQVDPDAPALAARAAFREKLLLVYKLGYGG